MGKLDHSITYMRDDKGAYGFTCSCSHSYTAPSGTCQNVEHRSNLIDSMIRHHEAKHKKKR